MRVLSPVWSSSVGSIPTSHAESVRVCVCVCVCVFGYRLICKLSSSSSFPTGPRETTRKVVLINPAGARWEETVLHIFHHTTHTYSLANSGGTAPNTHTHIRSTRLGIKTFRLFLPFCAKPNAKHHFSYLCSAPCTAHFHPTPSPKAHILSPSFSFTHIHTHTHTEGSPILSRGAVDVCQKPCAHAKASPAASPGERAVEAGRSGTPRGRTVARQGGRENKADGCARCRSSLIFMSKHMSRLIVICVCVCVWACCCVRCVPFAWWGFFATPCQLRAFPFWRALRLYGCVSIFAWKFIYIWQSECFPPLFARVCLPLLLLWTFCTLDLAICCHSRRILSSSSEWSVFFHCFFRLPLFSLIHFVWYRVCNCLCLSHFPTEGPPSPSTWERCLQCCRFCSFPPFSLLEGSSEGGGEGNKIFISNSSSGVMSGGTVDTTI